VGYAVIGAGAAGLTSGEVLARRVVRGAVFEADVQVGGIARTVERDGYRFDLGGHRFFTKLAPVQRLWEETLGDELLTRPRLSRIRYGGRYLSYPLRLEEVIDHLGLVESARCGLSALAARIRGGATPQTFEEWVTRRFGKRLYDTFFRSYTEKVWGIPGSEIQSEWAAQRIKNLSLWRAVLTAVGIGRTHVTSLIEEFRYPRLGPGQMWEAFAERVEAGGIPIVLEHRCVRIEHEDGVVSRIVFETPVGELEHEVDGVLSSMPLSELVLALEPAPPAEVAAAARRLRYRDLCLVGLVTDDAEPFPDNWIYLHDPGVRAGRVQNFGAWSEGMTQPGRTSLGVEYFCFRGDDVWELDEEAAVELATRELASIGLLDPAAVVGGVRIHVPRAYPMYDSGYGEAVEVLRDYVAGFENLVTFGRNGLHRYNNQDHSMWTAVLASLNLLDGADYDVWSVNSEAEYLEEGEAVEGALFEELAGEAAA
jgi:protoporphyrinogen oxidase